MGITLYEGCVKLWDLPPGMGMVPDMQLGKFEREYERDEKAVLRKYRCAPLLL